MVGVRKGLSARIAVSAALSEPGNDANMLSLPLLAKVTSAAIAASLTASMTFGHYPVSGTDSTGLMPPASILRPDARPGAALDPFGEIMHALTALKLEEAKSERNRAMVDWLLGLEDGGPADFTVQRLEAGLVYAVRHTAAGTDGALREFVAIPYGPEMPFAIRLMTGADGAVRVEGYSCTGQQTLEVVAAMDGGGGGEEAAAAEALSHAEAYLAAPDAPDLSQPADCLITALTAR